MCIRFAQVTILSHPLWSISQTQVSLLEECSVNEPVENEPFWCGFKFHLRVFEDLFLRSIVTDSTPLLLLECPLHVLNPFLALILFPFFFFFGRPNFFPPQIERKFLNIDLLEPYIYLNFLNVAQCMFDHCYYTKGHLGVSLKQGHRQKN